MLPLFFFSFFLLGSLNDHLFGKKPFIPFIVHIFRGRLSFFVRVLLSFLCFRAGLDCMNS